jgi:transcriptional regulator with XRE-family HTH domain
MKHERLSSSFQHQGGGKFKMEQDSHPSKARNLSRTETSTYTSKASRRYANQKDMRLGPNVGLRLRLFRERQGWSLRALAERCGLSINAISRIERGENSPTVSSLHRLANALSVPITDFFTEPSGRAAIFVRNGFGQTLSRDCYDIRQLGLGLNDQQIEPFLLTIHQECDRFSERNSHTGQEFVHCISGQIEYCVGDEIFHLSSGDSLLFDATRPHSWRNVHSTPATMILVFQAGHDGLDGWQRHLGN